MSELLQPGQLFAGRYRVERFLARGGYGAVFAAEQVNTETPVAIKVLWPHLVDSGDIAERFKLEARVAGRIRSDHIVRVFDTGYDKETSLAFLVMELLDGVSLQGLVEKHGPLEAERVADYLIQVASGLDKAHRYVDKEGNARPIVHRDLKPENLFVTRRDNGAALIKILDFGIAKVTSSMASSSQGIKGTPLYMSYEQVANKPITPATDVWALGLIAFFLLTGKRYWRCAEDSEVTVATLFGEVLGGDLELASDRARHLGCSPTWPARFDKWFARCVNREPETRYQRAGEAAQALAEALLGIGWAATLPQHTPPAISTPENDIPSSDSGSNELLTSAARSESRLALSRTEAGAAGSQRRWIPIAAGVIALAAAGLWLGKTGGSSTAAASSSAAPEEPTPAASPTASEAVVAAPAPSVSVAVETEAGPPVEPSSKPTPKSSQHRQGTHHATSPPKPAPSASSSKPKSLYGEW